MSMWRCRAALLLQVAVANDGTIFVADGYCNSRVVRYSASGKFEVEYRLPRGEMDIPHSLVLDECNYALYVADRENSEVHKFVISDQRLQGQRQQHGLRLICRDLCCTAH